ncbi:MAG: twin-arginine translocation signal domain-containing protein, partial [Nitrososphaerales archaeon]
MVTRRRFLKYTALAGLSATALRFSSPGARVAYGQVGLRPRRPGRPGATPSARVAAQPGTILLPVNIPKFQQPLVIPPAMPQSTPPPGTPAGVDYYEIAVRQFRQQILPPGLPMTTVWGYGSANHPATFNYPAFTVEATVDRPVRVKWINDLKDDQGNFLAHLLPVDQTLHWANPPGPRDDHGI